MSESDFHVPTYAEIGRELIESADGDSLDAVEGALILVDEELDSDEQGESLLDSVSDEELRVLAVMSLIKNGTSFGAKIFGIKLEIRPEQPDEPPPKPDESGDREPRGPLTPVNTGAIAIPVGASSKT